MNEVAIERLLRGLKDESKHVRKRAALRLTSAAEAAGDWDRLGLSLFDEDDSDLQAFARQVFRTGISPIGLAAATVPALVEAIREEWDSDVRGAMLDALRAIMRPVRLGANQLLGRPRSKWDRTEVELLGQVGGVLAQATRGCPDPEALYMHVVERLNNCLRDPPLVAHAEAALGSIELIRAGSAPGTLHPI